MATEETTKTTTHKRGSKAAKRTESAAKATKSDKAVKSEKTAIKKAKSSTRSRGNGGSRNGGSRGSRGGNGSNRRPSHSAPQSTAPQQDEVLIAPPKYRKGSMRIVPLGGLGEIGRNMNVVEYNGHILLIDCGANAECTPEYLLQFAYLGSYYAQRVMGIEKPRVGLLNIGAEEEKGDELRHETYALLREASEAGRIHFIGNLEANEALMGGADVLVTDGFTGNVMLKSLEGTAKFLLKELKKTMLSSTKNKLGAALLKSDLNQMKKLLDPSEVGGTAFLGISKPVFKAHGGSDAKALCNAILRAKEYVESGFIADIERDIDLMKVERNPEKNGIAP